MNGFLVETLKANMSNNEPSQKVRLLLKSLLERPLERRDSFINSLNVINIELIYDSGLYGFDVLTRNQMNV